MFSRTIRDYTALATLSLAIGLFAASGSALADERCEAQLSATATASFADISGKAKFESKNGRVRFDLQVEGFTGASSLNAMIGTFDAGAVTIDGVGRGEITFDSNFEAGVDDPATRVPTGFPITIIGKSITVGSELAGTCL